jgi:predicted DNA-binding transcriptional regulator AlpA
MDRSDIKSDRQSAFQIAPQTLQLLRVAEICKLLKISKPTFWRLRRSGEFPEPTMVTERVLAWRLSEIEIWLAARRGTGPSVSDPRRNTRLLVRRR